MNPFPRVWRAVSSIADHLCALCVLAITVIVMYQVVARTFFSASTIWEEEVAVYLMLAVGFLGLGPALQTGDHVRIDFLFQRFNAKVRRCLEVGIRLGIALFAGIAAWEGVGLVQQSLRFGRKSPTILAAPIWIPQLLIPIGCFLLLITALVGIRRVLSSSSPDGTASDE